MRGVEPESELQRIDRIRRLADAPRGSGVVLGIGDDCAIFRQRGATEDLVFTTDMLVEDVHFRRATHRPEDVGWKALARVERCCRHGCGAAILSGLAGPYAVGR